MEVCEARDIHPQPTQRSGHTYCFTPNHHGAGTKTDSQWLPNLPRDEEFAVFDLADLQDLSDPDGNLYGLRIGQGETGGEILELGTQGRSASPGSGREVRQRHWHGHPLWPIDARGVPNRRSQKYQPPPSVFAKMVAAGLISEPQAAG